MSHRLWLLYLGCRMNTRTKIRFDYEVSDEALTVEASSINYRKVGNEIGGTDLSALTCTEQ